ncbi:MAG TPA: hypothetical protein DCY86_17250 [Bdellovibrionales bacterium]|nr:hypothetical protein [Bdellovibrionales bacterium]
MRSLIILLSLLLATSCGPDMLNGLNKAPVNQLKGPSALGDPTVAATPTAAPADSEGNCLCPYNYAPVCGSDGMTYGNSCVAECKKIPSYSGGECPKATDINPDGTQSCICTLQFMPVCGTDGNTYGNSCVAKCNSISSYTLGACPHPTVDACVCPLIYSPVCGSDKQTYSNGCLASCANITTYSVGKCSNVVDVTPNFLCKCPYSYAPVCGSDKKTYSNACMAKCHDITSYTNGKCLELFYPRKFPLEIEDLKIKIPVLAAPIKWSISK